MTTEEIIGAVGCRTCNVGRGEPCFRDPGTVHDIRRQDALLRRALDPSFLSRGRDCAWCGKSQVGRPRTMGLTTWVLCPDCCNNPSCVEALTAESQRQQRMEQRRQRELLELAGAYPEQQYKTPTPAKPWPKWTGRPLTACEKTIVCPVCGMTPGNACIDMRVSSLMGSLRDAPHPERQVEMAYAKKKPVRVRGKRITEVKSEVKSPWMVLPLKEDEAKPAPATPTPEAIQRSIRRAQQTVQKIAEALRAPVVENTEKAQGATLELKPLTGTWRPRVIQDYLVEGMDWPWTVGTGAGEIRVYYTLNERKLWIATISLDKDSPGGLARDFWKRGSGAFVAYIDTDRLLHPVEVAADHRSGGQKLRWFGVLQAVDRTCGVAEFLCAGSAVEAIELSERLKNPQLQLKKPERRFNFE